MPLDCSHGSVIHIQDFESEGFEATDKFVFIIGPLSPNVVLAFVITKQKWNLKTHENEIVILPQGSVRFFPHESYIQCFNLHKLDIDDLRDRFDRGFIQNKGLLGIDVLQKVMDVAAESELLPSREIQEIFAVLRNIL